jgi:hypothetical protein
MNEVSRTVPGLREAMFDVLDQLRGGDISHRAARAQLETAKTICLTVACEYRELQVLQKQIEIEHQVARIEHNPEVIDYGPL